MAHTLKTAALMLVAVVILALATSIPAAADQIDTITFSGASWSDGGSLNGTFKVDATTWTLLSADVVTGNGVTGLNGQGASDGFVGQTYLYNVSGQANTVTVGHVNVTQAEGYQANEIFMGLASGAHTYLDWQNGSSTLWVGTVGGQYSSEHDPGIGTRSLNDAGGSAGIPESVTPEPSSLLMLGTGLAGCLGAIRRKFAR